MKKKKFPEGSVCKPCWELKYCPYGYLVEYFPHYHHNVEYEKDYFDTREAYNELVKELSEGKITTPSELHDYYRRLSFLDPEANEYITQFSAKDVACKIFGHTCPVFFMQSGANETKEPRYDGRKIPRKIMLKVVRRDNHVCQSCHNYIPDDEIEFDHIIPISKGGPTSVDNLRLLCRKCNRKKSNSLNELLDV